MNITEIIGSGFYKRFIAEYIAAYFDGINDEDCVDYLLCIKKIKEVNEKIESLGYKNLSLYFRLSTSPGRLYVDKDNRAEFWISRFEESLYDNIDSLTFVKDNISEFEKRYGNKNSENKFWSTYPEWQPEIKDLTIIIAKENDLVYDIVQDIANKDRYLDFKKYETYIESNKAIEILFKHCELLACLFRLERLKSFLEDDTESKIEVIPENTKTSETKIKSISDQDLPAQPINKQKPELPEMSICFNKPETIDKLFAELKGYFQGKENELLKALNGQQLTEMLLFPHNQNKFVEVFKRLKYNGYLLSSSTEIKNWICSNFNYRKKQGDKLTVEDFKSNTVWDILTKKKCEPTIKERICIPDWLPYKSHSQREKETKKEKL